MGDQLTRKQNHFDRNVFWGLALAACLLTFLVCPFSPIYRYNFEPDEICYHTVSLGWLRGKLPYRDLFDHKGPLTYVIYALGLLLTGQHSVGIMFVFMAINAAIFIFIYRNLRLCFDSSRSLCATILLLILFFVKKDSMFASATKPDHFILLMLLIAEFIFVRGIKRYRSAQTVSKDNDSSNATTNVEESRPVSAVYRPAEMLIMGLCCGAVFMIKLNVCIYFLSFIGLYLLWLLTQKLGKSFLASCGMFLLGIGAVSLPFFLYFAYKHALSDFLYAYFTYNSNYAKHGGVHVLFSRPYIDVQNTWIILILFIFMLIAGFALLSAKKNKFTQILILFCGIASYAFISFPEVYAYTFVLLIPLYIWGCAVFIDLLFAFLPQKGLLIACCLLGIVISVNFVLYQLVIYPSIPYEAEEMEVVMDAYYEANPDSVTIYFFNRCHSFFYSKTCATPDFAYFYVPRSAGDDFYTTQMEYVSQGLPDVIAFLRPSDVDDDLMSQLDTFFIDSGYSLYYQDEEEYQHIVYVRTSTLP